MPAGLATADTMQIGWRRVTRPADPFDERQVDLTATGHLLPGHHLPCSHRRRRLGVDQRPGSQAEPPHPDEGPGPGREPLMAGRYDLVIIGMGSAGMVAAEFAATLGVRVAAVERSRVGGDCLWTGCVPSKALLASAKAAHTIRHAGRYGLTSHEPEIDTARVWQRVRDIQRQIADTDDSPGRFADRGIELHMGPARLVSPTTVQVGDQTRLETRFVLLCTGSRPVEPPIPGLADAGFQTSETFFELPRAPASLAVLGGGPASIELAQACTRLGVSTTVLQKGPRILPRDEPTLVSVLTERLRAEGVDVRTDVDVVRVEVADGIKVLHGTERGDPRAWGVGEILVGVGRRPNVEGLGLDGLGIEVGPAGVVVDERRRTRVRSVYAAGDLAGRHLFTHSAGYEAARAIRNMFLPGGRGSDFLVPWATFTDPELAHAGLTEAQARDAHGEDVAVWRQDLIHSDRARADSASEGAVLIVTVSGRIVGAHALAPNAGELIHELALAIHQKLKLTDIASLVHVYPTVSVGIQQLAGEASYEKAGRYRWLVRSTAR